MKSTVNSELLICDLLMTFNLLIGLNRFSVTCVTFFGNKYHFDTNKGIFKKFVGLFLIIFISRRHQSERLLLRRSPRFTFCSCFSFCASNNFHVCFQTYLALTVSNALSLEFSQQSCVIDTK